jgi:hypothetical protein
MAIGFEIADVAKISGATKRAVIFWADNGALRAFPGTERRGTGVRRSFSAEEIMVASVLNAAAERSVSIRELIRIAEPFRAIISTAGFKDIIMDTAMRGDATLLVCDDNKVTFWSERTSKMTGEDLVSLLSGKSAIVINLNACLLPVLLHVFNT